MEIKTNNKNTNTKKIPKQRKIVQKIQLSLSCVG